MFMYLCILVRPKKKLEWDYIPVVKKEWVDLAAVGNASNILKHKRKK